MPGDVARFRHAQARHEAAGGDYGAARAVMREACEAWPEIRMELLEDPVLEAAINGEDL